MNTRKILNIDSFLLRNQRFWWRLQEHCVAACCGLEAFEFSEANIIKAATAFSSANIAGNLEEVLQYIEENEATYLVSHEVLNSRRPKEEIVGIFEKIRNVLVGIP
jgi:hypothetical protein